MAARPAVSVIIPAYNGEEYLHECLDSVFSQTLRQFQVICVNDGSTDHTAQILYAYQQQHPDMIIVTQDNGGLSAARNAGLACATGEYIDFLDCDDTLQEDALECLYRRASHDSLDILFFDGETIYASEKLKMDYPGYEKLYRTKMNLGKKTMTGEKLFVRLVEGESYRSSACMYLLRNGFLQAQGFTFFPGIYYEDNVFTLQCLLSAERASVDPTPYYKRNIHNSSIVTAQKKFEHARSYYICQNAIQSFLLSHSFSSETMRCAQQQITSLLRNAMQVYGNLSADERKNALAQYPDAILMDEMLQITGVPPTAASVFVQNEHFTPPLWLKKSKLCKYTSQKYQPDAPFVSVIIPVYHAAEYLRETVHDLHQQTLHNFEIIFVDGGSSDDVCKILECFAGQDPRIHVLRQKNQYVGIAHNPGMAYAKGEYILFLGADNRFHPDLLTYTYACAIENKAQIVLFHADLLQMPQETYIQAASLCPCKQLPKQVFSGIEGRKHIFDVLMPGTGLFSRNYLQSLGIEYHSMSSSNDLSFSMVAMACAKRIAPLPIVLVHYRVGQAENHRTEKEKSRPDAYKAMIDAKNELEKRNLLHTFQKQFTIKAIRFMIDSLDASSNLADYQKLYQLLHCGGLKSLGFECLSEDDLSSDENGLMVFRRCQNILKRSYEEHVLSLLTKGESVTPATALVRENSMLRKEVYELRHSYSYRVGNKLISFPHKIKQIVNTRKR